MTQHDLKLWSAFFEPVAQGLKTFEVRRDDRRFRVGDRVRLREFVADQDDGKPANVGGERMEKTLVGGAKVGGVYTGREIRAAITYVLRGPQFCIPEGWAVLSIRVLEVLR